LFKHYCSWLVVEWVIAAEVAHLINEINRVTRSSGSDKDSSLGPLARLTVFRAEATSQEIRVPVLLVTARLITHVVSSVNLPSSWVSSDSHNSVWISTRSTSSGAINTLKRVPVIVLVWSARRIANAGNWVNVVSRVGWSHNKSWSSDIARSTELRAVYALSIEVLSSDTTFIASISSEVNWKSSGGSCGHYLTIGVLAGTSSTRALKTRSSVRIIIFGGSAWQVADGVEWIYDISSWSRINHENSIYNWARWAIIWARNALLLSEVIIFTLQATLVADLIEAINRISLLSFDDGNKPIAIVTWRATIRTI